MTEIKLAVGPSTPGDIDAEVIELTDTTDKPDGVSDAEYVASIVEDAIEDGQNAGYVIRQVVPPNLDRFQDPDEVSPAVDYGR